MWAQQSKWSAFWTNHNNLSWQIYDCSTILRTNLLIHPAVKSVLYDLWKCAYIHVTDVHVSTQYFQKVVCLYPTLYTSSGHKSHSKVCGGDYRKKSQDNTVHHFPYYFLAVSTINHYSKHVVDLQFLKNANNAPNQLIICELFLTPKNINIPIRQRWGLESETRTQAALKSHKRWLQTRHATSSKKLQTWLRLELRESSSHAIIAF